MGCFDRAVAQHSQVHSANFSTCMIITKHWVILAQQGLLYETGDELLLRYCDDVAL